MHPSRPLVTGKHRRRIQRTKPRKAVRIRYKKEGGIDNIKHKMNNKTMEQAKKEPEVANIDATLSDAEIKNVIDAVEPIIKKKTSAKPKTIRTKAINLYNDQPLQVKLENGAVMTLSFSAPVPK